MNVFFLFAGIANVGNNVPVEEKIIPLVVLDPIGILLGFLFAISMGGLIYWMLRVPPHISAAAATARRRVGAIKKILVPTVGVAYSERGVELACRLGDEQKAKIILAYIIEVPRTLPLEVPIVKAEVKAKEVLEQAKSIVTLRGLNPILRIERARIAGEEIVELARNEEVDLIVMGIKPKFTYTVLGSTTETVLRKAPCEVIIDKISE